MNLVLPLSQLRSLSECCIAALDNFVNLESVTCHVNAFLVGGGKGYVVGAFKLRLREL